MKINFGIRVDGDQITGSGHVHRCLTIADELSKQNVSVYFISRFLGEDLRERITKQGHSVQLLPECKCCTSRIRSDESTWLGITENVDADQVLEICARLDIRGLLLDHYGITPIWEKMVQVAGLYLVAIDDYWDRCHKANLLINYNYLVGDHNHQVSYKSPPDGPRRLLGVKYFPLKPEFLAVRKKTDLGLKEVITISLGYQDHNEIVDRILSNLDDFIKQRFIFHIFLADPQYIEKRYNKEVVTGVFKIHNFGTDYLPSLLGSKYCIGSGGVSSYERIYLRLPSLVFGVAMNQHSIMKAAHDLKLVRYLGPISELTDLRIREELSFGGLTSNLSNLDLVGRGSIDGKGAFRIARGIIDGYDHFFN